MTRTDEERESICKKFEEETNDLLDEWIGYDDEDEQSLTLAEKCQKAAQLLSISGIADDEVDGPMKDLKRMFGNCFGKEKKKKDITLNYPST